MKGYRKIFAVSAVAFIVLLVLLAAAVIYGIWLGGANPIYWKGVGTLLVIFVLTGFLHLIAKGVYEKQDGE